ncbi:MAG: potassium channel family protein [Patescibacteria group bacterium]|nr:MAG: potassium channel family protein [Patescibacteria group bacterium]
MDEIKHKLHKVFYGKSYISILFNNTLLAVNAALIFLVLIAAFFPENKVIIAIEIFLGVLFLSEYMLRLWVAPKRVAYIFRWMSILDAIVIFSLFAPAFIGNLGFLRLVRSLQMLRLYKISRNLYHHEGNKFIIRNKEIIIGVLNLVIFLLLMTSLVFVFQVRVNTEISTYLDAMYFTISTLTTTGFGDITPEGAVGKFLTILIMVFGITLFVRLAKSMFHRPRIDYVCRNCKLGRHDLDAIHCKHCGATIKNDAYKYLD